MSDKLSWPDWYRYNWGSITNDIVLGDKMLFRLSITPDARKYIQWGNSVHIDTADTILLGQFDFELISSTNRTRSKVDSKH